MRWSGPRARDLRDIGFLRFRKSRIAGKTVEIGRIGMAGNLAFEMRGPIEEEPEVYDAVSQGRPESSAWSGSAGGLISSIMSKAASRSRTWTLCAAGMVQGPGFRGIQRQARLQGEAPWCRAASNRQICEPGNARPLELGWQGSVRFDHDFIGRQGAGERKPQTRDGRR